MSGIIHPFIIQIVQKLSERVMACHIQHCSKFLDLVQKHFRIVNALLMSDEAHFHFSCYEEMFSILGSTQPP
jgi:hypothetical protein